MGSASGVAWAVPGGAFLLTRITNTKLLSNINLAAAAVRIASARLIPPGVGRTV